MALRDAAAAPNCTAARVVGLAPAYRGQPGYFPSTIGTATPSLASHGRADSELLAAGEEAVEILGIPWAVAGIYAGWSGKLWLYVVLVFLGIILYALIRQRAVISAFQISPARALVWLLTCQSITVGIFYGIGAGASMALQ